MKKNKILAISLLFSIWNIAFAQEKFNVEIEPIVINGSPAIHSFSWGKTSDDKWVIVGGRLDGLHQRQPFSSFPENNNNMSVYVVDPVGDQTWTADISVLPASIFEHLQSTNQQFIQRENTLYVIGGYGYSATVANHTTFANLTAINVDGLATAVINGDPITNYFRQIQDSIFAVTGGQLGRLDSTFYLAGGQYFYGQYNPLGPDNGTGFIQQYTNGISIFKLKDETSGLMLYDYFAYTDSVNLHRRDYNMSPQIYPDGSSGFTMWSGVFDPNNLPFLNSVDITEDGYTVNNNFTQYLSQYHSAKIPVYDVANNAMHTLFFGGMSQYTLDSTNNLVQDDNVPFVKTISRVTRLNDGTMQEVKLNIEMPTLVGSGAEFIPIHDTKLYYEDEILDINAIPQQKTLIGYVVGGIESTLPNIFFTNDGTQSSASNVVFKIYINKSTVGVHEKLLSGENVFNLNAYPNPATSDVNLDFFIPNNNVVKITVFNALGQLFFSKEVENSIGSQNIQISVSGFPSGNYIVKIQGVFYSAEKPFVKK